MPKYLLTNEVIAAERWQMLETNPAYSEDLLSEQTVGKSAVCTYFRVLPGVTNATAEDFPADLALAKSAWRSDILNGDFAAGTWTFSARFESTTKYGFSIKVAVRLSRSASADGSSATLIGIYESPNIIAIPASAGGSVSDSWTASLDAITLTNEYLFAEYRIHIEVAGGNATAECAFACDEDPAVADESITTTTFTPGVVSKTVTDTLSLADAIPSGTPSIFFALTDSLALADALPSGTPKAYLSLTDALALADVLPSGTPKAYIPVSDSLALMDAVPAIKVFLTLTDSMSLADAVSVYTGVITKTVTDSLSLIDAAPSIKVFFTLTDVLSLADIATGTRLLTVSDALSLADVVSFLGKVSLTDTLILADQISTIVVRLVVNDSLSVAETLALKAYISVPDNLSVAEAIGLKVLISISDSLALAEAVRLRASLTISDTLALAEAISAKAKISMQDSLALAEAISLAVKQAITVTDSLTIADNMDEPGATPVLVKLTPSAYKELERGKIVWKL